MPNTPEINTLLQKISQEKVILFVGNGATIDAGGPKTQEIVDIIKKNFPGALYSGDDFIQTCSDVIETTATDRKDLETLIRKPLFDVNPSPFHMELPLHVWRAIFTTNYDDVIERAYRGQEKRVQLADPVFGGNSGLTLHDKEKVKVVYLMGNISSQHPDNKLALTRQDYNSNLRNRGPLFKVLSDLMRDGTILFVGYSFRDNLLSDIFADLNQTLGDNLPYSYALMPDIDLQSIQATKLRERKVIPIKLTASGFLQFMQKGVQLTLTPLSAKDDAHIVIKGEHRSISHRDFRFYTEHCDIITEEVIKAIKPQDEETIRDFFRGVLNDWTGYARSWDFKRLSYTKIYEHIKSKLDNVNVKDNKSILLLGPAGSGKTIALRRIAFDVYKQLGNPVVMLRPHYEGLDLKMLATLCEEFSMGVSARNKKGSPIRSRVLILMESASSHITDFKIIPTFMKSRGIPVTVLGASRENEWLNASEEFGERITDEETLHMSDVFQSPEERLAFARHLKALGLVEGLTDVDVSYLIEHDYQNSFFASVFSLIEPSRPTLQEKIADEFAGLSPLGQKAYSYVSALFQYSLPVPLELLVRTLKCSYEQFLQDIYQTEAKRIIIEVAAPLENIFFGTRHRIIAEQVINNLVKTQSDLADLFLELLRNTNYRSAEEVDICRSLLIHYLGPKGIERRLTVALKRRIFEAAIQEGGLYDSAIMHHFALFESQNGDQDKALELATEALHLVQKKEPLFL